MLRLGCFKILGNLPFFDKIVEEVSNFLFLIIWKRKYIYTTYKTLGPKRKE
jgi:hypothetical protein